MQLPIPGLWGKWEQTRGERGEQTGLGPQKELKDIPGTLVRTGIKIFLRNTVSSVLYFVFSSFQATEGINSKIFCFDSCAFGLSPGEEMIVLFKYYCFHEVEKTSLGYMQVPPLFFFAREPQPFALHCCGTRGVDVHCKVQAQMTYKIIWGIWSTA